MPKLLLFNLFRIFKIYYFCKRHNNSGLPRISRMVENIPPILDALWPRIKSSTTKQVSKLIFYDQMHTKFFDNIMFMSQNPVEKLIN